MRRRSRGASPPINNAGCRGEPSEIDATAHLDCVRANPSVTSGALVYYYLQHDRALDYINRVLARDGVAEKDAAFRTHRSPLFLATFAALLVRTRTRM